MAPGRRGRTPLGTKRITRGNHPSAQDQLETLRAVVVLNNLSAFDIRKTNAELMGKSLQKIAKLGQKQPCVKNTIASREKKAAKYRNKKHERSQTQTTQNATPSSDRRSVSRETSPDLPKSTKRRPPLEHHKHLGQSASKRKRLSPSSDDSIENAAGPSNIADFRQAANMKTRTKTATNATRLSRKVAKTRDGQLTAETVACGRASSGCIASHVYVVKTRRAVKCGGMKTEKDDKSRKRERIRVKLSLRHTVNARAVDEVIDLTLPEALPMIRRDFKSCRKEKRKTGSLPEEMIKERQQAVASHALAKDRPTSAATSHVTKSRLEDKCCRQKKKKTGKLSEKVIKEVRQQAVASPPPAKDRPNSAVTRHVTKSRLEDKSRQKEKRKTDSLPEEMIKERQQAVASPPLAKDHPTSAVTRHVTKSRLEDKSRRQKTKKTGSMSKEMIKERQQAVVNPPLAKGRPTSAATRKVTKSPLDDKSRRQKKKKTDSLPEKMIKERQQAVASPQLAKDRPTSAAIRHVTKSRLEDKSCRQKKKKTGKLSEKVIKERQQAAASPPPAKDQPTSAVTRHVTKSQLEDKSRRQKKKKTGRLSEKVTKEVRQQAVATPPQAKDRPTSAATSHFTNSPLEDKSCRQKKNKTGRLSENGIKEVRQQAVASPPLAKDRPTSAATRHVTKSHRGKASTVQSQRSVSTAALGPPVLSPQSNTQLAAPVEPVRKKLKENVVGCGRGEINAKAIPKNRLCPTSVQNDEADMAAASLHHASTPPDVSAPLVPSPRVTEEPCDSVNTCVASTARTTHGNDPDIGGSTAPEVYFDSRPLSSSSEKRIATDSKHEGIISEETVSGFDEPLSIFTHGIDCQPLRLGQTGAKSGPGTSDATRTETPRVGMSFAVHEGVSHQDHCINLRPQDKVTSTASAEPVLDNRSPGLKSVDVANMNQQLMPIGRDDILNGEPTLVGNRPSTLTLEDNFTLPITTNVCSHGPASYDRMSVTPVGDLSILNIEQSLVRIGPTIATTDDDFYEPIVTNVLSLDAARYDKMSATRVNDFSVFNEEPSLVRSRLSTSTQENDFLVPIFTNVYPPDPALYDKMPALPEDDFSVQNREPVLVGTGTTTLTITDDFSDPIITNAFSLDATSYDKMSATPVEDFFVLNGGPSLVAIGLSTATSVDFSIRNREPSLVENRLSMSTSKVDFSVQNAERLVGTGTTTSTTEDDFSVPIIMNVSSLDPALYNKTVATPVDDFTVPNEVPSLAKTGPASTPILEDNFSVPIIINVSSSDPLSYKQMSATPVDDFSALNRDTTSSVVIGPKTSTTKDDFAGPLIVNVFSLHPGFYDRQSAISWPPELLKMWTDRNVANQVRLPMIPMSRYSSSPLPDHQQPTVGPPPIAGLELAATDCELNRDILQRTIQHQKRLIRRLKQQQDAAAEALRLAAEVYNDQVMLYGRLAKSE